jgi:hypothetical protein
MSLHRHGLPWVLTHTYGPYLTTKCQSPSKLTVLQTQLKYSTLYMSNKHEAREPGTKPAFWARSEPGTARLYAGPGRPGTNKRPGSDMKLGTVG